MSEGGGGKTKLILIAVLALVLLGGGGFGYKVFVLDKKKAAAEAAKAVAKGKEGEAETKGEAKGGDEEEEEEPKAEGGGHGEGGGGGPAVLIYRQIVNLEAPRKNTFLKVELHILFRDPELGKSAAGDKPTPENSIIRAMLLEKLSGRKLEEAQDTEAREALRLEIKDSLNEKFKPKPPKEGEKEDPKHKKPKKPVKDVLIVDWAIQQG